MYSGQLFIIHSEKRGWLHSSSTLKFEAYVTSDSRKNDCEDPHFETAIVKVINQRGGASVVFTRAEKEALNKGHWRLEDRSDADDEQPAGPRGSVESDGGNFALKALKRTTEQRAKALEASRSPYKNPIFLPGTTYIVERLFSAAKLIQSDKRTSLDPSTLEVIASLKVKRSYWDIETVATVMKTEMPERVGSEQFDQRAYWENEEASLRRFMKVD
uniref:HAT C-terminal dimerisation domain-containing protein n=1 Tax=Chromera velia CCMP2878 TaxID=1169474 RepID=A0A0G4HLL8_9ALVE|eukprot:Cvel_7373.t1-p1 / transcript=Cvel_7373.t1 / gene=Cvel_7373 / organism=Chromera_velia_CCMP2878 / gene_product=hypothetical protein / transcript_product=hypothetical protein / location=Cvel_scaffold383:76936-81758(+) / protein_length=215 / sequence_SO=supercontig / SO=protein_coding / is_pseudo=false